MKLTTVTALLISTLPSVFAQGHPGLCYPSTCGYAIVNSGQDTQSGIAQKTCGRTDTCSGQEWNTVFHMDIQGRWYSMGFCSTGCYIEQRDGCQWAGCH
ncbi:uncharacterized protein yc1106_05646 [Curvularia clavata]|uniref:Uncharacterized protein n=1 Tax=Curvularia clavata TaxID=95742 RepID=A0A9Q8Z8G2_CURCL|nr:uncharacterized protein yc1106_05646 [Curvularia clavata]